MNSGSSSMPARVSTAYDVPGTASRSSRANSRPTPTSIGRSSRALSAATSHTAAPFEITASPWEPTWSKTSRAHRNGRPVTKTTGTPRRSTSSSTSRV